MPHKDPETRRKYNRDYNREWSRNRYASNPVYAESVRAKARRRQEKCREAIEPIIQEFRKNGCKVCGELESCCLVAHHLDPSQKDFEISSIRQGSFNIEKMKTMLTKELKNCVCLCHNCHSKVHADLVDLSDY